MANFLNLDEITEVLVQYNSTDHCGFRCGLKALDDIMRLDRSTLAICVSRPSEGKSTFLNYYTYLMAKENGWKTLYIPFEGSTGRFVNDIYHYYGDVQQMAEYSAILDNTEFTDIEELLNTIKEAKETKGIDMVVLDNFTCLQHLYGSSNETYEIGRILTSFTQLAKKLNICFLLVVHTRKMNKGEEIDGYSASGSAHFFNLADYIFSVQIADRERYISEITTLKIRNNIDCGVCGRSVLLNFNPITKVYTETTEVDLPFGDYLANMYKTTTTTTLPQKQIETVKIGDKVLNIKEEKERTEEKKRVPEGILNNTKVSVFQLTPQGQQKIADVSLFDAIQMGEKYKENIQQIRNINRDTNEGEYKRIKLQMPMHTVSCSCGNSAKEIDNYTNIICLDIDEKDNPQTSIEDLRQKVNSLPYTLFSSISVGGKGLYCLVAVDGDKDTFINHFKALQDEFSQMGIVIDKACKNLNRLRVISTDTAAYYNEKAEIYTKIKINYPKVTYKETQTYKANHTKDKATFEMALKDIEERGLIITKNHQETLDLSNCLASVWGEEGREYLHTIRKQRKGYDEYKLNECFNTSLEYIEQGHKYTLGTFYKYYHQVK